MSYSLVPQETRSGNYGRLHEVRWKTRHHVWRRRLVALEVLPLPATEADLGVEVVLVWALEQLGLLGFSARAAVEVDAVAVEREVAVLVAQYEVVEFLGLATGRRRRRLHCAGRWRCRRFGRDGWSRLGRGRLHGGNRCGGLRRRRCFRGGRCF